MAWIPSHQELGSHPKTRRAARLAGASIPAMVGHLHLLWHWALDHAPSGDVSRYEAVDLADAAQWDGDPGVFVQALTDCGPGDTEGYITSDGKLKDWDQYGGKYLKRVQEGRKAAAKRWQKESDGNPDGNPSADPMGTHEVANAEKSREEKKTNTRESVDSEPALTLVESPGASADADGGFDDWWSQYPRKVDKAKARTAYQNALTKGPRASRPTPENLVAALALQRTAWRRENRPPDKIPHATTWLNGRRWEDEDLGRPPQGPADQGEAWMRRRPSGGAS